MTSLWMHSLRPADIDAIVAILREPTVAREYFGCTSVSAVEAGFSLRSWISWEADGIVYLVARRLDNGCCVGGSHLCLGSVGYFVHPESRRRGYGSAILRETCRVAEQLGLGTLRAATRQSNTASRRTLESGGFRHLADRFGRIGRSKTPEALAHYIRDVEGPRLP